jgi:hypothetical protein
MNFRLLLSRRRETIPLPAALYISLSRALNHWVFRKTDYVMTAALYKLGSLASKW